jgi:hypothetical protein
MGREIDRDSFSADDFARFDERLRDSLVALERLLTRPGFGAGPHSVGAELEMALVDSRGRPAPANERVADELDDPDGVALEVARFSIEFDTPPVPLAGRPFTRISDALREGVDRIAAAAAERDARVAVIGILPTLTRRDLQPRALTGSPRYRALSRALEALKPSRTLEIRGREEVSAEVGIAAEGANAAFQVHLRVEPSEFARTFNAAQMATAPVLAVSGNSPVFLGRLLWEETRIPVFRQAVDGSDPEGADWRPHRVGFGSGWLRTGALEPFQESVSLHRAVLPVMEDEDPLAVVGSGGVPALGELRLHHGTVWSWNRAVFDPSDGGHVRIELRALPAGPSIPDMAASAAFLVGLTLAAATEPWMVPALPFECARRNFDVAARDGLQAELLWPAPRSPSPERVPVAALVPRLLEWSAAALVAAGVDPGEAESHLSLVRARVERGVTGASWQRDVLAACPEGLSREEGLRRMLAAYLAVQAGGEPVCRWPDPTRALADHGTPR